MLAIGVDSIPDSSTMSSWPVVCVNGLSNVNSVRNNFLENVPFLVLMCGDDGTGLKRLRHAILDICEELGRPVESLIPSGTAAPLLTRSDYQ